MSSEFCSSSELSVLMQIPAQPNISRVSSNFKQSILFMEISTFLTIPDAQKHFFQMLYIKHLNGVLKNRVSIVRDFIVSVIS